MAGARPITSTSWSPNIGIAARQLVIGKGGARLREVGTAARTQIEKLLGTRIYLDLRVKAPRTGSATQNALAGIGF